MGYNGVKLGTNFEFAVERRRNRRLAEGRRVAPERRKASVLTAMLSLTAPSA